MFLSYLIPFLRKKSVGFIFEWVMWSENLWEQMPLYAAAKRAAPTAAMTSPLTPTGLRADGSSRSAQTLTPFYP